eukprot:467428-Pelagomonas_calceolata.AAC.1
MYAEGYGCTKNAKAAKEWSDKAAARGYRMQVAEGLATAKGYRMQCKGVQSPEKLQKQGTFSQNG